MVEVNSKFKNSKDRKTFIQLDYLIYRNLANFDAKLRCKSFVTFDVEADETILYHFQTSKYLGVLAFIASILRSSMLEMSSLNSA